MYSKTDESTSEKEAVYRPPPPTPLRKNFRGGGGFTQADTHFDWLYKKLGRFLLLESKFKYDFYERQLASLPWQCEKRKC